MDRLSVLADDLDDLVAALGTAGLGDLSVSVSALGMHVRACEAAAGSRAVSLPALVAEVRSLARPGYGACRCISSALGQLHLYGTEALEALSALLPSDVQGRVRLLSQLWEAGVHLEDALGPLSLGPVVPLLTSALAERARVVESSCAPGEVDVVLASMLHVLSVAERPWTDLDGDRASVGWGPGRVVARAGNGSALLREALRAWSEAARTGAAEDARDAVVTRVIADLVEDGYYLDARDGARVREAVRLLEGVPSAERVLVVGSPPFHGGPRRVRRLRLFADARWSVAEESHYRVLSVPALAVPVVSLAGGTLGPPFPGMTAAAEVFLRLWPGDLASVERVWSAAVACVA